MLKMLLAFFTSIILFKSQAQTYFSLFSQFNLHLIDKYDLSSKRVGTTPLRQQYYIGQMWENLPNGPGFYCSGNTNFFYGQFIDGGILNCSVARLRRRYDDNSKDGFTIIT